MITPKRTIHGNVKIERERSLPISGVALTEVGDKVEYDSSLLSAEIKGEINIIRLAEKFGIDPDSISNGLLVKVGDHIKKGDPIFFRKGMFSFLDLEEVSEVDGEIEFISEESGHIGVRLKSVNLKLDAFMPGIVKDIIKNRSVIISAQVGLLQGIVGYGGEGVGVIKFIDVGVDGIITIDSFDSSSKFEKPTIIVGGSSFSPYFFEWAKVNNVIGIVTASFSSELVRDEFKTSILGTLPEYNKGWPTVIVVEGFGKIDLSKKVEEFFRDVDGKLASINGLTQVRAGAIRPELIIHEPSNSVFETSEILSVYPVVGDTMRIVRGEHFGSLGKILDIPKVPEKLNSGIESHIAVLDVQGQHVKVSFANLENI